MSKGEEIHPFWHGLKDSLERLIQRLEGTVEWEQIKQAEETPNSFTTVQGIAVPDPTQVNTTAQPGRPTQIVGARKNRETVIISNTGQNAIYVANNPNDAIKNGFTITSGGVLSMDTNSDVYAWCPGGSTSTVDVIETLYDRESRKQKTTADTGITS